MFHFPTLILIAVFDGHFQFLCQKYVLFFPPPPASFISLMVWSNFSEKSTSVFSLPASMYIDLCVSECVFVCVYACVHVCFVMIDNKRRLPEASVKLSSFLRLVQTDRCVYEYEFVHVHIPLDGTGNRNRRILSMPVCFCGCVCVCILLRLGLKFEVRIEFYSGLSKRMCLQGCVRVCVFLGGGGGMWHS